MTPSAVHPRRTRGCRKASSPSATCLASWVKCAERNTSARSRTGLFLRELGIYLIYERIHCLIDRQIDCRTGGKMNAVFHGNLLPSPWPQGSSHCCADNPRFVLQLSRHDLGVHRQQWDEAIRFFADPPPRMIRSGQSSALSVCKYLSRC